MNEGVRGVSRTKKSYKNRLKGLSVAVTPRVERSLEKRGAEDKRITQH